MKIQPFLKELKVTVEAYVNPSEDVDKVKTSIRNLIKHVEPDFSQDKILTTSTKDEKSLYFIYERIRAKQTLAVVRRLLLRHMNEETTWLIFNKQAAFVGSVNVCEEESESPLGPIKLIIQSPYLGEFIDWLTTE
ncbi:MAG: hypothetical protein L6N94_02740 [Candidatus Methylarchaceae archaeon HK01M]|nr:hypothetical protein [Candidatus Methylarchaceae archaeon HK01M]